MQQRRGAKVNSNTPQQQGPEPAPKNKSMLLRSIALATAFVLAAVALSMRLGQLQVTEASEWEALASRQQLASLEVTPARGNIYDSEMRLLAQSAAVWTVVSSPDVLVQSQISTASAEREAARVASRELAALLGLDEDELYAELSDEESRYYKIISKIEKPLADEVRAICNEYNIGGIYLVEDSKRYYPYEELGATVLGFVGAENSGLEGLEFWYDDVMAGVPGRTTAVIDALGNEVLTSTEGSYYAAENGNSLVLTLNTDIQRSVEEHLAAAVEEHNARERGFAIVMDVNTGAILAMAVYPSYNPNEPYDILDADALEAIGLLPQGTEESSMAQAEARTLQWRNKTVADTYEPGSVMKIITAAAALDSGIYSHDSTFNCGGFLMIDGWDDPISCAGDPPTVHAGLTLSQALIESCNVSFMHMAAGMGASVWYDYVNAFGLTEPTGIDLPGEPSQAAIDNLVYSEEELGAVQLASCSFGQSNKYTAVQMITAVAAAINGGNLMQPYIVDQVLDPNGNVISTTQPVVKRQVISEETSAQLRSTLQELVEDTPNGRNAYATGFEIGGKSGTSQKLDVMLQEDREDAFISSFLGFAPADDPQIAVLVALDEPEDPDMGNYFGGRLVGPTVREIMTDILPLIGVEAQYDTDEELARTTVATPQCVDQELSHAQRLLNDAELTYHTVGSGNTVIGQSPAPYTQIPYGGQVVLYTDASIPQEQITMPDVVGQRASNAIQLLESLGLNVQVDGAPGEDSNIVVSTQSVEPQATVPRGSVVTLVMIDNSQVN